jgi:hypothetical protein
MRAQANVYAPLAPIAVSIEASPRIVGVSRTRIFEAIRNSEISARKAGRSTIIEIDELQRWVKSLPIERHELTEMVAQ